MKKILIVFFVIDLIFIGLVLKIAPSSNRHIASIEESQAPKNLTEGQRNKWLLVKSFQFNLTSDQLTLTTDLLQSLCDVSSVIELVYLADHVAYSGVNPTVHHAFSCSEIKKDMSKNFLTTSFNLIKQARKKTPLTLEDGTQIRAYKLFDDESLPKEWILSEIQVTGHNNFTINRAEIEEVLGQKIQFTISAE